MSDKKIAPEFSRPIEATRVNTPQKLKANEVECAAIAKRLKLPSVTMLEGSVILARGRGDLVSVEGELKAKLSQTCVVTLEPFETEITTEVDATYSDGPRLSLNETVNLAEDDPDAPEPVVNGKIDLGELLVQTLSLALDPYPRKPGAEFTGYDK